MIPKGIENADAIIEACRQTLGGLDPGRAEWREVLESVISIMEDLKTRFFLKTNLAIPVTNACRRDAVELQSLMADEEMDKFPGALERLRSDMEGLLKRAKMDGVIIT